MDFILFLTYVSIYLGLFATTFFILSHGSVKKEVKQLYRKNELPKVSIIVPAYNEEKSIGQTIESILKSNYPSKLLEILVVDDGSKDKTLEIIKKYKSKIVKVFSKTNGGKGSALNLGIKKSTGEIIITLDADTFILPNSVYELVRPFKNPEAMSVTPSMLIYNPKSFLQKIQQAEYLFGLFLRKAFSAINSNFVTPGAFSAYRKSFFDKYGGYDEKNITEDLEISLRIQSEGYLIDYAPKAVAYTVAPSKFKTLLIQRRRWYTGLIKNTILYKRIFSKKYGDLGLFVYPVAWISIFLALFLTTYMVTKILIETQKELFFLASINFDVFSAYNFGSFFLARSLFNFFMNPVMIFFIVFVFTLSVYMNFATKNTGKVKGLASSIVVYFLFFAILFGFWWITSFLYSIFQKEVSWS